jgi:hypothetical protein
MADENINEADLISTLVELGLLKEYKQLAEILFENKELLKIKVIIDLSRIKKITL